jgi:hypothetical protein
MVVYACISSTWEAEAGEWELEAGLGYIAIPYPQIKIVGLVEWLKWYSTCLGSVRP